MTFPEGPVIQRDVPLAGGQIGIIHACPSCGVGISRTDYEALRAELHQRDETIARLERIEEAARAHVNQPNNSLTFQGLIDALSDAEALEFVDANDPERGVMAFIRALSDADLGKGK